MRANCALALKFVPYQEGKSLEHESARASLWLALHDPKVVYVTHRFDAVTDDAYSCVHGREPRKLYPWAWLQEHVRVVYLDVPVYELANRLASVGKHYPREELVKAREAYYWTLKSYQHVSLDGTLPTHVLASLVVDRIEEWHDTYRLRHP